MIPAAWQFDGRCSSSATNLPGSRTRRESTLAFITATAVGRSICAYSVTGSQVLPVGASAESLPNLHNDTFDRDCNGCPSGEAPPKVLSTPRPAHNIATSAELRRRRAEHLAAAQDLTRQIGACKSVYQAVELYNSHADRFNAIHFSALFVSLARLACGPTSARSSSPGSSGLLPSADHSPLSPGERYTLRHFLTDRLVPDSGLRLMGFGPRQLTTVLSCLAQLGCPPPAFWLAEWLQHFGRRLRAPPLPLPAATAPPPSAQHAPPDRANQACVRSHQSVPSADSAVALAVPPTQWPPGDNSSNNNSNSRSGSDSGPQQAGPADLAMAMWGLARLRLHRARQPPETIPTAPTPESAAVTDEEAAAAALSSTHGRDAAVADGSSVVCPRSASDGAMVTTEGGAADYGGVGPDSVGPSLPWLRAVAIAFGRQAAAASAANIAAYLWGAARLGYRPPKPVMDALVHRCGQLMRMGPAADGTGLQYTNGSGPQREGSGGMGARELAGVLWALVALGYRPEPAWLHLASAEAARIATGVAAVAARRKARRRGGVRERQKEEARKLWLQTAADAAADGSPVVVPEPGEGPSAASAAASGDEGAPRILVLDAAGAPGGFGTTSAGTRAGGDRGVGSNWWGGFLLGAGGANAAGSWRDQGQATEPCALRPGAQHALPAAQTVTTAATVHGSVQVSGSPPVPTRGDPNCAPLDARHAATCLWALTRLGHRPRPAAIAALMHRICPVPGGPPAAAGATSALAPSSPGSAANAASGAASHCSRSSTSSRLVLGPGRVDPRGGSDEGGACKDGKGGGAVRPGLSVRAAPQSRPLRAPPQDPSARAARQGPSRGASPLDLSMLSYSLGALRFRPQPAQMLALLVQMATRLGAASRQDLVLWLTAVARLRLAVPGPWFAMYLRRMWTELEALPPLALVVWMEALPRVYTTGVRGCVLPRVGAEPQSADRIAVGRGRGRGMGATRGRGTSVSGATANEAAGGGGQKVERGGRKRSRTGLRSTGRGPRTKNRAGSRPRSGPRVPWVVLALPPPGQWRQIPSESSSPLLAEELGRGCDEGQNTVQSQSLRPCSMGASSRSSSTYGAASEQPDPQPSATPAAAAAAAAPPPAPCCKPGHALWPPSAVQQGDPSGAVLAAPAPPMAIPPCQPPAAVLAARETAAPAPPNQLRTGQRLTRRTARATAGAKHSTDTSTRTSEEAPNLHAGAGASDIVVHRGTSMLHRQLTRRLLRLAAARMPYLDLEQQCRLAWATARLRPYGAGAWVDVFVRHTSDALRRHLSQRLEQSRGVPLAAAPAAAQEARQMLMALPGGPAAAAGPVETVCGPGRGSSQTFAPSLVKLLWAVTLLLRRSPQLPPVRLTVKRRQRPTGPSSAADPGGGAAPLQRQTTIRLPPPTAAASPHALPSAQAPRLWCALLLAALLPQLPSLTDGQLLRLVVSLAYLRAPKRPPKHLAARLGDYCRRRVEATCGGEEACDITTAGLLHWTQGWEKPVGSCGECRCKVRQP